MTTTTETFPVTFHAKVTNQTLHDLFVCAVEGGINYWAGVSEYHWGNEDPETGKLVDDVLKKVRLVLSVTLLVTVMWVAVVAPLKMLIIPMSRGGRFDPPAHHLPAHNEENSNESI